MASWTRPSHYRKALAIKPDFSRGAQQPRHLALKDLVGYAERGNRTLDEAVASYHKALAIKPDYAEAHSNLGNALKDLGKRGLDEAVGQHNNLPQGDASPSSPIYAEAHNNLGNALKDLGKLDEAVASYHKALAIKPDYAEAHNNLGNALQDLGD